MRTLVVSGADEAYYPLLDDLISSLRRWPQLAGLDIGCLDVGLAAPSRVALAERVAHIVEPGWDLPLDEELRESRPGLRALTARPFVPQYFPGYDVYVWIDADAWVQFPFAIDWMVGAARDGALGAVAHEHAAYETSEDSLRWRTDRMLAYFGQADATQLGASLYLNSGVLAARADAPHWAAWARSFKTGLEASRGKICTDQTPLNHAVSTENLPVRRLPAICNWLTHLAMPGVDADGNFCEPIPPADYIGIMHLTRKASRFREYPVLGKVSSTALSLRYRKVAG